MQDAVQAMNQQSANHLAYSYFLWLCGVFKNTNKG